MEAAQPSQREVAFWVAHVKLGTWLVGIGAAMGLAYVAVTPHGPHRFALGLVALGALLSNPLIRCLPIQRWAAGPHRMSLFYVWCFAIVITVTTGCALDGGATSPVAVFYFANLAFTSVAFSRNGLVVMGAAQISGFLLTTWVGTTDWHYAALFVGSLALVSASCGATSARLRGLLEAQTGLSAQLEQLATIDGLTGCLNYRAFHRELDAEVSRAVADGRPLALLLVDVDGFKSVNDSYGHPAGDELLRSIAAALRDYVREGDVVGRLGGDEFAVLAPGTKERALTDLAQRIHRAMGAVHEPVRPTVSVGGSVLLPGRQTSEALRQQADQALYHAKRAGRDQVALYAEEPTGPRTLA